jgi:hypothetical protein
MNSGGSVWTVLGVSFSEATRLSRFRRKPLLFCCCWFRTPGVWLRKRNF